MKTDIHLMQDQKIISKKKRERNKCKDSCSYTNDGAKEFMKLPEYLHVGCKINTE